MAGAREKLLDQTIDGVVPIDLIFDFIDYKGLSVQYTNTGTVAGALVIEGSDNNVNWDATPIRTFVTPPGGAPGGSRENVYDIHAGHIRIRFTPSGGAGNISLWATKKGHG